MRADDEDPRIGEPKQAARVNLINSRGNVWTDGDFKDVGNRFLHSPGIGRFRDGRDAGMVKQEMIGLVEIGNGRER